MRWLALVLFRRPRPARPPLSELDYQILEELALVGECGVQGSHLIQQLRADPGFFFTALDILARHGLVEDFEDAMNWPHQLRRRRYRITEAGRRQVPPRLTASTQHPEGGSHDGDGRS